MKIITIVSHVPKRIIDESGVVKIGIKSIGL